MTPHGSEFQAGVKTSSRLPSPVPRQSICLRFGTGRSRSHMSYGATVCVDVTGIRGFSRPGSSLNTMSESCLTYIATVRILLTKYIYVEYGLTLHSEIVMSGSPFCTSTTKKIYVHTCQSKKWQCWADLDLMFLGIFVVLL